MEYRALLWPDGLTRTEVFVLKLGGSVMTDKTRERSPRLKIIDEIAEIISLSGKRLLIVHGGGSFAHPTASKYELQAGYRDPSQLMGYAATKRGLLELQGIILDALIRHGVAAIPFTTSSFVSAKGGRINSMDTRAMRRLFQLGLPPVLSGDVVADEALGFSIVSGDQLAPALAIEFQASQVIFGCDVDGVFTEDPKRSPNARLIPKVDRSAIDRIVESAGPSSAPDVTSGMAGKLRESKRLVEAGIPATIVNLTNPQNLKALLEGRGCPCTRIVPGARS